ncbi:TIGR03619 family F420-dependent LLM class oxidoreductase [Pseudonocardia acaciae]|uniref:TIGR03619 family F420-dependent LLM class oxidoreductase n=1 Tax=Pseudonocardia acaciae TaxID=551276 RepID=UPI000568954D|nr:TIGR03619 family F420-dependent LLM class oxidoreductase [Pseudonocardia acaciae]
MSVDLQVVLPDESPEMEPESLVELGVTAERLGFHTAWLPDHLLPPTEYGETYGGVYEPLTTLAYLGARTSVIGLGTSVLVLPMRSPFVVAKQVATLDRLTGERVNLGVGVGWDEVEYASVGADFAGRGRRTDEGIALVRRLFRGDGPPGGVFRPLPRREVPITVGGVSDRALVRAARLADEWQGFGLTAAGFARCVARLRELTDRPVRVGTRIEWPADGTDPAEVVARVEELAEAGADAVAVHFGGYRTFGRRMTEFAEAWHPLRP